MAMASIRSGEHHVIQACTGAGKTALQAAICRSILATLRPGWVVVNTAPRVSLVEQTAEAYARIMPGEVGAWYGRRKRLSRVVVACQSSADSLADEIAARGLRVAFWLADEVHRADTDQMIAAVARWAPRTRLGLTATPFRSAESERLRGWSRLAYRYPIDRAIRDGVLVPWAPVPWTGEHDADPNEATLQMIRESAPAGPGLVSAVDIEDATWYAAELTAEGVPAEAIHSKLGKREQKRRVAALLSGDLRCLVHVDLLTEGVDMPPLRWLAMRRARRSAVAIVQEVGRVLRTTGLDAWGPKTAAVLLLPHATPILHSVSRDPALQAELLREAAENEVQPRETPADPAETLIPAAVARGEITQWLSGLAIAVGRQGVDVAPLAFDRPDVAITPGQYRRIRRMMEDRRRAPVRLFPGATRAALYAIMQYPDTLTIADASALLAIVYGAGARYRAEKHRTGRHWRLSPEGLPTAGFMDDISR